MINVLKKAGGKVTKGTIKDLRLKNTVWVDSLRPSKKELSDISAALKIPINDLSKYLDPDERPKVVEFDNCSLVVFGCPTKEIQGKITPVAIFITDKNNIATLRTDNIEAIDKLKKIITDRGMWMDNPGIFASRLLGIVIEGFYKRLDAIEDEIDSIEAHVVKRPEKISSSRIFKAKKQLIYFHKALIANREVLSNIQMEYVTRIKKRDIKKYRELYNEVVQLIDMDETYREILTGVLDIYLTSISNNLNIVMKRLTVYASYILVPTLISGIYGMNFVHMPEIDWKLGYPFALGIMVLSVIVMHYFFKRKGWI